MSEQLPRHSGGGERSRSHAYYGPPVQQTMQPPEFDRSFADLGVRAQPGRWIELRAPHRPGGITGRAWDRVLLTREAAELLLLWLPMAVRFADGEDGVDG